MNLVSMALIVAVSMLPVVGARAQLGNRAARIVVGHFDINATSVEAQKKFWVETLGGKIGRVGPAGAEVVEFPGIDLFLRERPPTGPTRGTTFDHIGFAVPNVGQVAARAVANGYALTVGREPGPGEKASPPTAGQYGKFAYLLGPDGVKVELVTAAGPNAPPIAYHHVHFVNKEFVAMQQWYMKVFDATLRPGQTDYFIGADLPGVGYSLNFFSWLPEEKLVGTRGRVVADVGFEVRGLREFCRALAAKGIPLTEPYRQDPAHGGIAVAALTDPWGTVIELTEGLRPD
ncbi:MAG TPA: VOC family protein [Gammaproteobacteria bacterium]|nr:VOC family protein [Gammaproteobacteria bacterium]